MPSKSMPLFFDEWNSVSDQLSYEELGMLVVSLARHAQGLDVGELPPSVRLAFSLMSASQDRYATRCARNSENGKKGGAPRGNTNARKTTETSDNKQIQAETTENKPHYIKGTKVKDKGKGLREGKGSASASLPRCAPDDSAGYDLALLEEQVEKAYSAAKPETPLFFIHETLEILTSFFHGYHAKSGEQHPRISDKSMLDIVCRLPSCTDAEGKDGLLCTDYYESIIEQYFKTNFADGCDYRISHFMTDPIRANRLYEVQRE